jgi:hypothetical protein
LIYTSVALLGPRAQIVRSVAPGLKAACLFHAREVLVLDIWGWRLELTCVAVPVEAVVHCV